MACERLVGKVHGLKLIHGRSSLVLFLVLMCSLVNAQESIKSKTEVRKEFILHPRDATKKVEFYWAKPEGKGPWPVIFYIHGHQEPPRAGAKDFVDWGALQDSAAHGYVAVAISQPGYGESNGPADFCGQFTQKAVRQVIDVFRKKDFVSENKVALYGISCGAIVASMLTTEDHKIAAAVLISGLYDLTESYPQWATAKGGVEKELLDTINKEAGVGEKVLLERSTIPNAQKIKTPLLILNGAKDDRTSPQQARELAELVSKNGIEAKAIIYPEYGHKIPVAAREKVINDFFQKFLKRY